MQQFFEYSAEVEQAIKDKKPLLALETTMLTHGLPFPHNLEITKDLENIVKENDAMPAFFAVLAGKVKIGLTATEIELLIHDKYAVKASTRDLPFVLNENLNAGLTVAATLFCADYAGIKVFATGGIGGVHRGDAQDTSADLIELARIPMAVICSGAKAILDLPRTLEFLETFSVPVVGYRTDTFPAFYTAHSSYKLPARCDNIPALVKYLKTHWHLGLSAGVLVANPIDAENEIATDFIEPIIIEALKTAEEKGIVGKALTPFLMSEIANATQGRSLQSNIKLLKNNVKLGAQIAHALTSV